ncbi:MAG: FtsX-like permease family protein [Bacteroidales bacterium]|nr:FtsX-like permease family protein [Bacteroidales bacterium]
MKIILKNLWNRRGRYAWLFIELIVVTALAWYILDKAVVNISDSKMPVGYDVDRLAIVRVNSLPETSKKYVAGLDSAQRAANFETFMNKLRHYEDVERISPQYEGNLLNDGSISINKYQAGVAGDTLAKMQYEVQFCGGTEYFETYGIRTLPGSPSPEELSAYNYNPGRHIVLTEDFARLYWPGENAVGKSFYYLNGEDTVRIYVAGVVENVRYQSFVRTNVLAFGTWDTFLDKSRENYDVLVRLKPGIDPGDFAPRFAEWAAKNMNVGNLYVKSVTPYADQIYEIEYSRGIPANRNSQLALAAFFLINLILGVTGSFFLQTRRRTAEMGVHRSFGATRSHIVRMLMGEGVILATVAFIIGDFIMLQVLLKTGLDNGNNLNNMFDTINNWVGNFWQHFAVISAVVYACILLCVLIGTFLPAWQASRVRPVDALRDE